MSIRARLLERLTRWIPDRPYLKAVYLAKVHRRLNLSHPTLFNEKMQWLKLYDRNPLYTTLVDKYASKDWISKVVGPEYLLDTLGVWSRSQDVDFECLPDKFVLKTNHDSGGVVICRDKESFDVGAAREVLDSHLRRSYYFSWREWPYRDVSRCVFAEEYVETEDGDLPDYKLFTFSNGRIVTLVVKGRFSESGPSKTFFDEDWNLLDLNEGGHLRDRSVPRPPHFEEMKRLATVLAQGFPFARVDFFDLGSRLVVGEITFYPNGGFERFDPEAWNRTFGSWIQLPR